MAVITIQLEAKVTAIEHGVFTEVNGIEASFDNQQKDAVTEYNTEVADGCDNEGGVVYREGGDGGEGVEGECGDIEGAEEGYNEGEGWVEGKVGGVWGWRE
jgi:hypothetical protein